MLTKEFIAGFICGEGSFSQWDIKVKEKSYKVFRFCITQHKSQLPLLEEIKQSLGCGLVRRKSSPKNNPIYAEFLITKTDELIRFYKMIFPHIKGFKKDQAAQWFSDLTKYKNLTNYE